MIHSVIFAPGCCQSEIFSVGVSVRWARFHDPRGMLNDCSWAMLFVGFGICQYVGCHSID